MMTCPFNTEGLPSQRSILCSRIKLLFIRGKLTAWVDKVSNGIINPAARRASQSMLLSLECHHLKTYLHAFTPLSETR